MYIVNDYSFTQKHILSNFIHRVTKEIKLEYGLLRKEQITPLEWGCVTLQLKVYECMLFVMKQYKKKACFFLRLLKFLNRKITGKFMWKLLFQVCG